MSVITTKEIILKATPANRLQAVPAPEISEGAEIMIRAFSGETRRKVLKPDKDGKMPEDNIERLLVNSICDESGELIFAEADIPKIGAIDVNLLDRCADAIMKLNGIGEKALEDAKGESEPSPK